LATYDLVCLECGHVFEVFVQGFLKNEDRQCPSCDSFKTRQKFSPFLTNATSSSGDPAGGSSGGGSGSGFS
jgi:putative FmdB family regulatory protein